MLSPTIARRACLAEVLEHRVDETKSRLQTARAYHRSVTSQLKLDDAQERFHLSSQVVDVVASLEGFMVDVLKAISICFPEKIQRRELTLGTLQETGSLTATIDIEATRVVRRLMFGTFPDMVAAFLTHCGSHGHVSETLIGAVHEIKCSRDLLVHGAGQIDATYVNKLGSQARGKPDTELPLDTEYVRDAHTRVAAHSGAERDRIDAVLGVRQSEGVSDYVGGYSS